MGTAITDPLALTRRFAAAWSGVALALRAETVLDGLPARLPKGLPKGQALREILEALVESLGSGAPLPRSGCRGALQARADDRAHGGRPARDRGTRLPAPRPRTFVAEPRVAQAVLFSSFSEDMRSRGIGAGLARALAGLIEAGPFLAGTLGTSPGDPVAEFERVRTADGTPMALERVYLPASAPARDRGGGPHGRVAVRAARERYGIELTDADQRVVAVEIADEEAELLDVEEERPGCASTRWLAPATARRPTTPRRCFAVTATRSSCARRAQS